MLHIGTYENRDRSVLFIEIFNYVHASYYNQISVFLIQLDNIPKF